ncbi:MAG: membrane protein insertase YidC, partial [Gammaproteobacteria bacterium]|nr:membrane protein insertase YidC [Gammaproteobacteria bacterium]
MDNQRILLYAALGFVMLILWQNWQLQYGPPAQQRQAQVATESATGQPAVPADLPETAGQLPTPAESTAAAASSSEKISVETDVLQVEIDSLGGTVSTVKLKKYPVSIDQKDVPFTLMSDDPTSYFVSQTGLQSADNGAPTHLSQFSYEAKAYTLQDGQSELRVPLSWASPAGVKVVKTLVFKKDSYRIGVEYSIENGSAEPLVVNQYRQLQRKPVTDNETQTFIYNYIGGVVSTPEDPYTKVSFDEFEESNLNLKVTGGWQAIIQHYFVGALLPGEGESNTFYSKALNSPKRYILGMFSDAQTIAPGQSGTLQTEMYIGPKDQDRLSAAADKLNLVVDFGWLTILANPIFWLLKKIHGFVGNWGAAIVLLTVLVKAVFFHLSATSYKSMAKMRKLQPKMLELRDRYGDDRQKLSQETMELYRKEKVNPLGGCLPILIQMPVFLSLYWVLLESVELRHAPLALWIRDLSAMDPYFVLPLL